MVLVVLVVLVALGVSELRGGGLRQLGALRLRSARLVAAAVVVQVAGALLGGPAWAAGLGLSALLVLAFLARNRGLRGTAVVALGLLANALVVGANGAMPVARAAADRAGVPLADIAAGRDPRHELSGPGTRLRLLGDVVPVPLPLLPQVVSPGDLLVAVGLGLLVLRTAGQVPTRPVPPLPPSDRGRLEAGTAVRPTTHARGETMAKKGRKRRARKKNAANHGKRPNA